MAPHFFSGRVSPCLKEEANELPRSLSVCMSVHGFERLGCTLHFPGRSVDAGLPAVNYKGSIQGSGRGSETVPLFAGAVAVDALLRNGMKKVARRVDASCTPRYARTAKNRVTTRQGSSRVWLLLSGWQRAFGEQLYTYIYSRVSQVFSALNVPAAA